MKKVGLREGFPEEAAFELFDEKCCAMIVL